MREPLSAEVQPDGRVGHWIEVVGDDGTAIFADTDTLHIELRDGEHDGTVEVTADLLVDLDGDGRAVGLTIEHAAERCDLDSLDARALPLRRTRWAA